MYGANTFLATETAMANPIARYYYVAVETFIPSTPEPTWASIRVRPLKGQGVSTDLRVECDRSLMRHGFPLGTVFILQAKLTDREGSQFIYSYFDWDYCVIDRATAETLINKKELGFYATARFFSLTKFKMYGAEIYRRGVPKL